MHCVVNQEKCIGCALCTGISPHTFSMNEDGKAHAGSVQKNTAAIQKAIEYCPVRAIEKRREK